SATGANDSAPALDVDRMTLISHVVVLVWYIAPISARPSPSKSAATIFMLDSDQPESVASTGLVSNWLLSDRWTVSSTLLPDWLRVATSDRPSPSKSPSAIWVAPVPLG